MMAKATESSRGGCLWVGQVRNTPLQLFNGNMYMNIGVSNCHTPLTCCCQLAYSIFDVCSKYSVKFVFGDNSSGNEVNATLAAIGPSIL